MVTTPRRPRTWASAAHLARRCGRRTIAQLPVMWKPALPERIVRSLTKDEFRAFLAGTGRVQIAKKRATVPINDQLFETLTKARAAAVTD